jgi:hypothetical protein
MTMDVKQIAHDAALMAERARAYAEAKKLAEDMIRHLLGRPHEHALTPILAATLAMNTVLAMVSREFSLTPTEMLMEMAEEMRELSSVEPDFNGLCGRAGK